MSFLNCFPYRPVDLIDFNAMAAPEKSIDMDEFNKFIDEQNIQYEIEIDCLRDSFIAEGMDGVIALAKSLNIHLKEPKNTSTSLLESATPSKTKTELITNDIGRSLKFDDLSMISRQESISSPKTPKSPVLDSSPLEDGSIHSKHWDKIQSMILLSRSMADKNEEMKSTKKVMGERSKQSYKHIARRSSVVVKTKKVVDKLSSPYIESLSVADTEEKGVSEEDRIEQDNEESFNKGSEEPTTADTSSIAPISDDDWRMESGVVREGREWANVIVTMQDRHVSPKRNYKALNKWRDWEPPNLFREIPKIFSTMM